MSNEYGVKDVLELSVFDENGVLIAHLDNLKGSRLSFNKGSGALRIESSLLSTELLKFQHGEQAKKGTDYKEMVKKIDDKPIVITEGVSTQKCKLIALGTARNHITKRDIKVTYEMPVAEIIKDFRMDLHYGTLGSFVTDFLIKPDENGDLVKIHGL